MTAATIRGDGWALEGVHVLECIMHQEYLGRSRQVVRVGRLRLAASDVFVAKFATPSLRQGTLKVEFCDPSVSAAYTGCIEWTLYASSQEEIELVSVDSRSEWYRSVRVLPDKIPFPPSEQQEHAGATDRTGWPPGPWDKEPDRLEWTTVEGFPALARRNGMGVWCGYVAVPPGHAMHGASLDDACFEVHGGITHTGPCEGSICRVAKQGEPDDVHWFGFDCGHAGDAVPKYCEKPLHLMFCADGQEWPDRHGGVYRDIEFVKAHCEQLSQQLAECA